MSLRGPALVSAVFLLVTALVGVFLVSALASGVDGDREFTARFGDVTGLAVGEDVKAAGVGVGMVTGIEVTDDNTVRVAFEVADSVPMTEGTQVAVRYQNLIGDRYLALSQGPGAARLLEAGEEIPLSDTRPALDLDELYNGFAPLFEGLSPDQINRLSGSLIAVLQGQGSALTELLGDVGSLTGTVADRDQAIGQLIDNLNTVLGTLHENGDEVGELVDNLQTVVSGLAGDRERIGRSLEGINDLTVSLSDLLRDARPEISGTVEQVDRLATVINADAAMIEDDLTRAPGYYQVLGRLGAYSSAFQFYICGVQLRLTVPGRQVVQTPFISSEVERCQF